MDGQDGGGGGGGGLNHGLLLDRLHEGEEAGELMAAPDQPRKSGRNRFNKRYRSSNKEESGFRYALGRFVDETVRPLLFHATETVGELCTASFLLSSTSSSSVSYTVFRSRDGSGP